MKRKSEKELVIDDSLEENIVHEDEKPRVGTMFSSKEELEEYYKSYAQSMGFGVTKLSSKNGDDGKKYFTLACSRGTKYVTRDTLTIGFVARYSITGSTMIVQ